MCWLESLIYIIVSVLYIFIHELSTRWRSGISSLHVYRNKKKKKKPHTQTDTTASTETLFKVSSLEFLYFGVSHKIYQLLHLTEEMIQLVKAGCLKAMLSFSERKS